MDAMRQEKALKGQFGMGFEQMASADENTAALGAKPHRHRHLKSQAVF